MCYVHIDPELKCAVNYILWAVHEIIIRKMEIAALFQKSPFAIKNYIALVELDSFKKSFQGLNH